MKKIITITAFLIIFVWLTGCKKDNAPANSQKKPTPVVQAVQATKGTISNELELTGSIIATRIAKMGSPAEGPVIDCEIREGDSVKKGQVLLKIGRRKAADAQVEAARESLSREKEELRRIEQLVDSGAIAAEELDMARLRVSRANAELSKALESAGDYEIEAPWDGFVSKVYVTDGYYVTPREMLVEIYDPCSLVICAAVPEKYAAEIATDIKVNVKLDAYPNDVFTGRVERIYSHLDPRLRTRTIEIILEETVNLVPGMFARLKVVLETVDDAVIVPVDSLVSTPKGHAIFVVKDGTAVKCSIETGLEEGNCIQILSGVNIGDTIIVAGNEKLKDGTVVSISGEEGLVKGKPLMSGQGNEQKNKMRGGQQ